MIPLSAPEPPALSLTSAARSSVEMNELVRSVFATELGLPCSSRIPSAGRGVSVTVDRERWQQAATVARDRLGCVLFEFLAGLGAPGDPVPSVGGLDEHVPAATRPTVAGASSGGLQLVARVTNPVERFGVILKTDLPAGDRTIRTWVPVWSGADWHERACWQEFGVRFVGHPDLVPLPFPSGLDIRSPRAELTFTADAPARGVRGRNRPRHDRAANDHTEEDA